MCNNDNCSFLNDYFYFGTVRGDFITLSHTIENNTVNWEQNKGFISSDSTSFNCSDQLTSKMKNDIIL